MFEVLKLIYLFLTKGIRVSELKSAIDILDNDEDGYISMEELYNAVKSVV